MNVASRGRVSFHARGFMRGAPSIEGRNNSGTIRVALFEGARYVCVTLMHGALVHLAHTHTHGD